MTINEIIKACAALTPEQRRTVNKALVAQIKGDNTVKAQTAMSVLQVGQRVEWTSNKYGGVIRGKLVSHGIKNCKVRADDGVLWTVYAGFLRPESGNAPKVGDIIPFVPKNIPAVQKVNASAGQKAAMTRQRNKLIAHYMAQGMDEEAAAELAFEAMAS